MVDFKWIQMSLFLISALQFTEAAEQHPPSFTVRAGDEVTLPCENVIEGQQKCGYTVWIFNGRSRNTIELIDFGQIVKNTKKKSDRLSVTENCSLVIKKVTAEDVGRYSCRQFNISGGEQQGPDSQVNLYVVKIQEHLNILYCSVLTFEVCGHTVKWLYEGNKNDVETSQSSCSASVTFKTTHLNKSNYYELLKCHVTDKKSGQVLVFPFSSQSSGRSVLDYIMLVMRVAELLLITVITVLLIRAAGNQRPPDDNTVHHDGGGHDGTVNYENVGDSSASVRLH